MTDQNVIALLFERKEEALSALSARCKKLCMTIARGILGSEEDAEECFNDTLHQIWNAIPPDKPDNLPAYTAKITRNISLNRLEKAKAQKRGGGQYEAAFEELEECLPGCTDQADEVIDRMALTQALNSFLDGLDGKDRELFLRRYFSFEDCKMLARDFGVKESALRMRLLRMREKLKEHLIQENINL